MSRHELTLPKTRAAMAKLDAAEAAFDSTPDAELGAALDTIKALELEAWLAFLTETSDRNDASDRLLRRHPCLAELRFLRARCAEVSP